MELKEESDTLYFLLKGSHWTLRPSGTEFYLSSEEIHISPMVFTNKYSVKAITNLEELGIVLKKMIDLYGF